MPTTLLDGESYESALHRRMQEEAAFQPKPTHTPGPWTAIGESLVQGPFEGGNAEKLGLMICELPAYRSKGDAQLIAASPELLDTLNKFREYEEAMARCDDVSGMLIYAEFSKMAHAAIAKATGAKA